MAGLFWEFWSVSVGVQSMVRHAQPQGWAAFQCSNHLGQKWDRRLGHWRQSMNEKGTVSVYERLLSLQCDKHCSQPTLQLQSCENQCSPRTCVIAGNPLPSSSNCPRRCSALYCIPNHAALPLQRRNDLGNIL
ncbi:uncharacterized protein F5Z01DRAFT_80313 [Emericellopsis atlantica]|uniref:Uncharacterized protein n=1 Tax=Emericellopsis atlantica TaxID=2614577 RepID=A0A9P7ZMS4_9HYPO|nr:uncharacterized protein F5Z01DRAFT_80313 [Emericellopsis atlantica]KAG9254572.1 hypothetical protein F5Z01DRAFT_80313 [Emericellopsis atlantica]